MEYLVEGIALALDSVVLGVCFNMYLKRKDAVDALKCAPVLELNNNLESYVRSQPGWKVPYCAIRGTVAALGVPIHNLNSKSIKGVVQKLVTKQHVITRGSAGFWTEQERTINEVFNDVPFAIVVGKNKVEILDAVSADLLDLDTISDHYEPTTSTLGDHLWGFFSGTRQQGLQTTEEMLREGTLLTSIGELYYDPDFKDLRIQYPMSGKPFFLTTLPLSSLIRKVDQQKAFLRTLTIIFGGVGVVLACMIARRWWRIRTEKLKAEERQRVLEETRKARRKTVRDPDLPESQQCVVCRENPREMILLPCGHVCLCEDCADGINVLCPVCRAQIASKAPAYFS